MSTDFDIQTIVAAVKAVKRFLTAEPWRGFVISAWGPLASANTDEELAQYARDYSSAYVKLLDRFLSDPLTLLIESSLLHAVGTAAMSQCGAPWGVLDPGLRVKGTKGLRVFDASALPYVPTGHSGSPSRVQSAVA